MKIKRLFCAVLTLAILGGSLTLQSKADSYDENGFFILNGVLAGYKANNQNENYEVTIPANVVSIGEKAFQHSNRLTKINLPAGLKTIENFAFEYCDQLNEITLPEGLAFIGESAFKGCSNLTNIIIPEGVTTIGNSAFDFCTALLSVFLPGSCTKIGEKAFYGCTELTSIDVDGGNPFYSSLNGALFNKAKTILYQVPAKSGNFSIPGSVLSIADSAFSFCRNQTVVNIPEGTERIGESTFWFCSALKEINIPKSVKEIGDYAFGYCPVLENITIPDSVINIGRQAFLYCRGFEEIILPDSVKNISEGAFSGCLNLRSAKLGSGVTNIGTEVFDECESLTEITVSSANESFTGEQEVLFDKAKTQLIRYPSNKQGNYQIPEDVIVIEEGAFSRCQNLESVVIPGSVTTIGRNAFLFCTNLKSVYLQDGITSIESDAFELCDSLTIVCPAGSYAENYAESEGIAFVNNVNILEDDKVLADTHSVKTNLFQNYKKQSLQLGYKEYIPNDVKVAKVESSSDKPQITVDRTGKCTPTVNRRCSAHITVKIIDVNGSSILTRYC